MKIEWRRLWITFGVILVIGIGLMYFTFGDWPQAFREAFGPAVIWTIIAYWVIGVFRRELNRPKPPRRGN